MTHCIASVRDSFQVLQCQWAKSAGPSRDVSWRPRRVRSKPLLGPHCVFFFAADHLRHESTFASPSSICSNPVSNWSLQDVSSGRSFRCAVSNVLLTVTHWSVTSRTLSPSTWILTTTFFTTSTLWPSFCKRWSLLSPQLSFRMFTRQDFLYFLWSARLVMRNQEISCPARDNELGLVRNWPNSCDVRSLGQDESDSSLFQNRLRSHCHLQPYACDVTITSVFRFMNSDWHSKQIPQIQCHLSPCLWLLAVASNSEQPSTSQIACDGISEVSARSYG